ncbi:hypothetical protein V6N11_061466 [Hibiscus sabdariffa]|uniref:Uncharacterized protein n=1 Tax=Hibiscus sabdariffa TaxID=183260 RepID=A0ABR2NW95_9ROSI
MNQNLASSSLPSCYGHFNFTVQIYDPRPQLSWMISIKWRTTQNVSLRVSNGARGHADQENFELLVDEFE